MSVGDAKCERCGRFYGEDKGDCRSPGGGDCDTAIIARLTAEVATLRAKLDDAEARWRAAELFATPTCGAFDGVMHCDATAEWSPADRDHRCTEHTTREGAGGKP